MKKYQKMVQNECLGPWGFGSQGPSYMDDIKSSDFAGLTKRIAGKLKDGVDDTESNIYCQHKPGITYLLDAIRANRTEVLDAAFPREEVIGVGNTDVTKDVCVF